MFFGLESKNLFLKEVFRTKLESDIMWCLSVVAADRKRTYLRKVSVILTTVSTRMSLFLEMDSTFPVAPPVFNVTKSPTAIGVVFRVSSL